MGGLVGAGVAILFGLCDFWVWRWFPSGFLLCVLRQYSSLWDVVLIVILGFGGFAVYGGYVGFGWLLLCVGVL